MARTSRTRYPILGALSLRPMSGYDIKKFVEGSIANFWRESYGQLYPTLRALTEEGLIELQRARGRRVRAERQGYRITRAGRRALEAWLKQPAKLEVPRSELLLKLFFGTEVPAAVLLRHVRERRRLVEANLARLEAIEAELRSDKPSSPGLPYWLLVIRQGVLLDRAILEWCTEAERELESLDAARS